MIPLTGRYVSTAFDLMETSRWALFRLAGRNNNTYLWFAVLSCRIQAFGPGSGTDDRKEGPRLLQGHSDLRHAPGVHGKRTYSY